jgi:hypothetical protein
VRRAWELTAASESGSALLLGLCLIMIITLLGAGFLQMATIEASFVAKDQWELQAFYCAEAQAARIFNLYDQKNPPNLPTNPSGDETGTLGSQEFPAAILSLANGTFTFSGSATVDASTQVVTVTATCMLPNGATRTVQRTGTRQFSLLTPHGLTSGFTPPGEGTGDLFLGGSGTPINTLGNNWSLGADTVMGKVYVAGNAYLRGQATVTSYGAGDVGPRITVYPGKAVFDDSTAFDVTVPGAVGVGTINPIPAVTSPDGTGAIDKIQAAANPDGVPVMKGTYNGTTVYNLTEIFNQLGESNEGNSERNLARPAGCVFGVASSDPKCQIWQDLAIIGPRRTCAPVCAADLVGPTDKPSYFFMGMPRSGPCPQDTCFPAIFAPAVNASGELRQLGFVPDDYSTLGQRLDALLGSNIDGEGRATRLVDFSTGVDPNTADSIVRPTPPIFYVDGYWRTDKGPTYGYNGVATVAATKSMILSDNIVYLGNLDNVNTLLPSCSSGSTDRTSCGLADMLGLMAKEDIWMGDPGAGQTIFEVSAVMLAGRDFNVFVYKSGGGCCQGVSNPLTFNGAVMAGRQAALIRDWANPLPTHENDQCNSAGGGGAASAACRPAAFFPDDASCGDKGCWKFMTLDIATGILTVDTSLPSFRDGCTTTTLTPLTPATCPGGTRRVTHFQLNVNYDTRLTRGNILPPGLPAGTKPDDPNRTYLGFQGKASWKDCGPAPSCG